jgi:hypothetical protein
MRTKKSTTPNEVAAALTPFGFRYDVDMGGARYLKATDAASLCVSAEERYSADDIAVGGDAPTSLDQPMYLGMYDNTGGMLLLQRFKSVAAFVATLRATEVDSSYSNDDTRSIECPPDCTNDALGTCPRCFDATGRGCAHGPVCNDCAADDDGSEMHEMNDERTPYAEHRVNCTCGWSSAWRCLKSSADADAAAHLKSVTERR